MKTAEKPAGSSRRSWFLLQGAAAGAMVVALPATALIALTLLGPALAFYAMETTAGRPVAKVMLLMGSTATVMPLRNLWMHANSLGMALDILSDPTCPILAWVACGTGWLLCELVQLLARLALATQTRRKMDILRREETELREEWTFRDDEQGPSAA